MVRSTQTVGHGNKGEGLPTDYHQRPREMGGRDQTKQVTGNQTKQMAGNPTKQTRETGGKLKARGKNWKKLEKITRGGKLKIT